MEFTQDRLRAEIRRLEEEVTELHRERGEVIAAEVTLAVICLIIGFAVGAWLA